MAVIIDGTTGITSVNGSAAAPSVTGTDTDTGIVYGTNTLSLATGGTTAMTIANNQFVMVGAGTQLPNSPLQVNTAADQYLTITSSSNTYGLYMGSNIGASHDVVLGGFGSQAMTFHTNGNERMRIDTSGNVGIGTSSPSVKADIAGVMRSATWSLSGTSITGGTSAFSAGTVSTDSNWGMYFRAPTGSSAIAEYAWVNAGGTERMRIDSSGNVGIGTSSPAAKFHAKATTAADVLYRLEPYSNYYASKLLISSTSSGDGGIRYGAGGGNDLDVFAYSNVKFLTGALGGGVGTERARIDSSGNLMVGISTATARFTLGGLVGSGAGVGLSATWNGDFFSYYCDAGSFNSALAGLKIQKIASTGRSLNAAGTINASGSDYAEYMRKSGAFNIAKGDVVGVDSNGELTNVFANAVSFVVKSTDPSYVGGDTWSVSDMPLPVPDDASAEEKEIYMAAFAEWQEAHENARGEVDRIAFCGQVPVNVLGATAGQFIVPTDVDGAIVGVAVNEADMTLNQYMKAVGKVIAIEQDGRAKIIVKVA